MSTQQEFVFCQRDDVAVKKCSRCKDLKPLEDFHTCRSKLSGRQSNCKKCSKKIVDEFRSDPLMRAWHAIWIRDGQLRKLYNITLDDYFMMGIAQRWRCAICTTHRREHRRGLVVDHDKETGAVRGLLCDPCNKGIGCLHHDRGRLLSAALYLRTRVPPDGYKRPKIKNPGGIPKWFHNLFRLYRILPDDYDNLVASHGNCCAICHTDKNQGKNPRLCIDHDHQTGYIRGLLCHLCNRGIGSIRHNPATAEAAAGYILSHLK